jgi:acetoacetyl-CoA synthetase
VTFFGAGAAFYAACMKAGITPQECGDLSRIRALGSTGSPLSAEVQQWGTRFMAQAPRSRALSPCRESVGAHLVGNISGGTDFAGAFIGGNRELPQTPGKMQCRMLGAAVEAWDAAGPPGAGRRGRAGVHAAHSVHAAVPVERPQGERYLSSYFDMYPAGHGRQPGGGDGPPAMGAVWRHGDWIRSAVRTRTAAA